MADTILIAEDEKNIQELLKLTLEQSGFRTLQVYDGKSAVETARQQKPSLILLDIMMPQLSGIEVCKILKQNEKTRQIPIIILTAKGEEIDKVVGLELGADDYMVKPFSPRELSARVKAVLRRSSSAPVAKDKAVGSLSLNVEKRTVTIKGKPIELTTKEFDLLNTLIYSEGRVLSREDLLERVWGYQHGDSIETRTIDMHILQIRKKIGENAKRLLTIKGIGYRFNCD